MTLTLQQYCEKYNYTIIEQYTTIGEIRSHTRAIVKDNTTGETYHLYYDPSSRKKGMTKKEYKSYMKNGILPERKARGWRNTTLDNRRYSESQRKKAEKLLE